MNYEIKYVGNMGMSSHKQEGRLPFALFIDGRLASQHKSHHNAELQIARHKRMLAEKKLQDIKDKKLKHAFYF